MKTHIRRTAMSALTLAVCCISSAVGLQGEDVDVEFREEVTADYEEYLEGRWEFFSAQLDDENAHARMALILVELGQIGVEANRASDRIERAQEDIDFQLGELEDRIIGEWEEEGAADLESLLRTIRHRIGDEKDEDMEEILDAIEKDNEEIEAALSDLGDAVADRMGEVQGHAEILVESDAPFAVRFSLRGEVLEVDRADIDDVEAIAEALLEAAGEMGDAFDLLEEVGGEEGNIASIQRMREAFRQLDRGLERWMVALAREPQEEGHGVWETLENTGDFVRDVRGWITDIDEILAGRVFLVGEMPVRPVALIENRTFRAADPGEFASGAITFSLLARWKFADADDRDLSADEFEAIDAVEIAREIRGKAEHDRLLGWISVVIATGSAGITDPLRDLLLDFYRAGSPVDYTFQGLFPAGLSPRLLKLIGADMVVNTSASREEMDRHMESIRQAFQARLDEDLWDSEANAGMAMVRTYFLIVDNHGEVEEFIEMAAEGDIVGIVERFDVEDFDYTSSMDEIRMNIEVAELDDEMVFILLEKIDYDQNPFIIDEDDDLVFIPLTGRLLGTFLNLVEALAEISMEMAEMVLDLFGRGENFFELDLDPNQLDFTEAESSLDFARALEQSNARFLQITPEGRDKMESAGDEMSEMLAEFSGAVTEMKELTASLDEEGGMNVEGMAGFMEEFDEFYREVQRDFEIPGSTTELDGRVVNMSAWFDNPPDSLLQKFIWMWDDDEETSNALGGLFPNGPGTAVLEYRREGLPTSFVLDQNYPNPFNSETTIRLALPVAGWVELSIYDLSGQKVEMLMNGWRPAGDYFVRWNGRDQRGDALASGVYLYRLRAGGQVGARKLLLLK
jgi:hypothetical protein